MAFPRAAVGPDGARACLASYYARIRRAYGQTDSARTHNGLHVHAPPYTPPRTIPSGFTAVRGQWNKKEEEGIRHENLLKKKIKHNGFGWMPADGAFRELSDFRHREGGLRSGVVVRGGAG